MLPFVDSATNVDQLPTLVRYSRVRTVTRGIRAGPGGGGEAVTVACGPSVGDPVQTESVSGPVRYLFHEVRLAPGPDGGTVLELEHSSPAEIVDELVRTYGPGGTIGIGGGWDLALLGLDLYLGGAELDPATWQDTFEAKEFATRSCQAWGPVIQTAWGTSDDDIAAAIAFGIAHFAPEG